MKRLTRILLVVAVIALMATFLVACGDDSSTTVNVNHGNMSQLTFSYLSQPSSVLKNLYVDEFSLSSVLVHVKYEDGYIDPEGVTLTEDMVEEDCRPYLKEACDTMIFVTRTIDKRVLEGSFALHLKERSNIEKVTFMLDPGAGKATFGTAASANSNVRKIDVIVGTTYSWIDFISAYPVEAPQGQAIQRWADSKDASVSYTSASAPFTITAAWSGRTLIARYTSDVATVKFDLNYPAELQAADKSVQTGKEDVWYSAYPVKTIAQQTIDKSHGYVVRPDVSTFNTLYGYTFKGWYAQKSDGTETEWSFVSDITANGYPNCDDNLKPLTLKAKWIVRTYTVNFNLSNGMVSQEYLAAMVEGRPTDSLGNLTGTIVTSDTAEVAYIAYVAGAVKKYISVSSVSNGATAADTLAFASRSMTLSSELANDGKYAFTYLNKKYYFTAPITLTQGGVLTIMGSPTIVSFGGLTLDSQYITSASGTTTGIPFALNLRDPRYINEFFKGAYDGGYYYTFAGWFDNSTCIGSEYLFSGTSKVQYSDYTNGTLNLYAKWIPTETQREKYYTDYLYKGQVELISETDRTVRIVGMNDNTLNVLYVPSIIKYDFDGDGTKTTYSVAEIGASAFEGHHTVTQVEFETLSGASGVRTIGANAFAFCSNLAQVNTSALVNLTQVGADAFHSTKWLTDLDNIAVNEYLVINGVLVNYIGSATANKVELSESLGIKTIAGGAFKNMSALSEIVIANTVERIESGAFENCTHLSSVLVAAEKNATTVAAANADVANASKLVYVAPSAFYNTKWAVGSNFVRANHYDDTYVNGGGNYYQASYNGFVSTTVSAAEFESGVYYRPTTAALTDAEKCLTLGSIYYRYIGPTAALNVTAIIPSQSAMGTSITRIGSEALAGYSNIANVYFGADKQYAGASNIVEIGAYAFSDTAWVLSDFGNESDVVFIKDGCVVVNGILAEYAGVVSASTPSIVVDVPDSVVTIASGAFSRHSCRKVSNVIFGEDSQLAKIEAYAFENATTLKGLTFNKASLQEVVESVEIDVAAFLDSNEQFKTYIDGNGTVQPFKIYAYAPVSVTTDDEFADYAFEQKISMTSKVGWVRIADDSFAWLTVQSAKFNITPSRGNVLPTSYLWDGSLDLETYWRATKWSAAVDSDYIVTGTGEAAIIANSVIVTRSDGVETVEDLKLNEINGLSAINAAAFASNTSLVLPLTFTKYTKVSSPLDINIYSAIQSLNVNGVATKCYNTIPALSLDGVTFDIVYKNGVTINDYDIYDEIDKKYSEGVLTPIGYSTVVGAHDIVFRFNNHNLETKSATVAISMAEPLLQSISQASSFIVPFNSKASDYYSSLLFELATEDGLVKTVKANEMSKYISLYAKFKTVSMVFEKVAAGETLDTSSIGVQYAQFQYQGSMGTQKCIVMYTVYVGTEESTFSYRYDMVDGHKVALITGFANAVAATYGKDGYNGTLMLPSTITDSNGNKCNVVAIDDGAFEGYKGIQTIYVPSTITEIGSDAFSGCTALKHVYSFATQNDITTPLVQADASTYAYFKGFDATNNMVNPIKESVVFKSDDISLYSINFAGQSEVVVPYGVSGKSGTMTLTSDGDHTTPASYNANYSYELTLGVASTAARQSNFFGTFAGKLYLPDKGAFYNLISALVESGQITKSAIGNNVYINNSIDMSGNAADNPIDNLIEIIYYAESDTPSTNSVKLLTLTDGNIRSTKISDLTYSADSAVRTGECTLVANSLLPISEGVVFLPSTYSGTLDWTYETRAIPTRYEYVLTLLSDNCFAQMYQDGAVLYYLPDTIRGYYNTAPDATVRHFGSSLSNAEYAEAIAACTLFFYTYSKGEADVARRTNDVFSSAITRIGDNAFLNCTALETLNLSEATSLNEIGLAAFANTGLNAIDLSNTQVTEIEDGTFANCTALEYVNLFATDGSIIIGKQAFVNCTALTLGPNTDAGKGFYIGGTHADFAKISSIGYNAFSMCRLFYYPAFKTMLDTDVLAAANEQAAFDDCKTVCTITFDKNNASATGTMATQGIGYDVENALIANGFYLNSKSFAGWATSANGAVVYTNEQRVVNVPTDTDGNVTLYAVWETPV